MRAAETEIDRGAKAGAAGPRRLTYGLYALAGTLAVLAWQAATVHFNFGGNWTALFCTGDRWPVPPELASGTYVFHPSDGFDGQFYRYVAHDPWFQRGFWRYHDRANMRCARILVPALAWCVALGQDRFIDAAYIAVILFAIFLGIYWSGRYAVFRGLHPAWGLGFLLLPATLTSIDRLTLDVAVVALCAGMLWYATRDAVPAVYATLVAAGLVRELGLWLAVACCLYALTKRQWPRAVLYATAALPAVAWYAFVSANVGRPIVRAGSVSWMFRQPVTGILLRILHPYEYPFGPLVNRVAQAADIVALVGFLLALALAVWSLRRWPYSLEQWTMLGFAVLAVGVSDPNYFVNVYNYARPLSPLLLLIVAVAPGRRMVLAALPVLLMDVRIAAQWTPQALGILRGVL